MDVVEALRLRVEEHQKRVRHIQEQVKDFYARQVPFRLFHGHTNSTRVTEVDPSKVVDTSHMNHVIEIEKKRHVAVVEPNVPMDGLVDAALRNHYLPPVVPEFPGITVGGSYAGTAGESSSWKYGFFDRTVNWVDIILADGRLVRASPEQNADLFYGASGAMGTLGVAVLFEVQLIPAKEFVETRYIPVTTVGDAVSTIQSCIASGSYDFIDGIQWSPSLGVVIAGTFSSKTAGLPVQQFSRRFDPWFYQHAEKQTKKALKKPTKTASETDSRAYPTELVPVRDYLFRYDRGAFWMGKYAFKMFHVPNDRGMRAILDSLFHTRRMYEGLHHSGEMQRFVIQDLALPAAEAEGFTQWTDETFKIWPLWLAPLRGDSKAVMQMSQTPEGRTNPPCEAYAELPGENPPLLINVGVWGPGRQAGRNPAELEAFVEDQRELERQVQQRGGIKWLYAQTYYSEDEFWAIYDKKTYDELRAKYAAGTLPTVYEKVKKPDGWRKMQRLRGVAKTILGRESLVQVGRKKA